MLICRKFPKKNKLPDGSSNITPLLLLVEDNIIALKMIQTLAEQANCRYICADSGKKALRLATENLFDLIITDLGLPDISGLELTQKIRKWELEHQKKAVPIIGLTVHAMNEEALGVGMNELLIKPLQLVDFQKLLMDYLPRPIR